MARDIFHCNAEMPRSERPFATQESPFGYPMMTSEMAKPETVRTMLNEADRRVASKPATWPNPMQQVHNLEPAKRGRHY
jgi:hypothetical protein